MRNKKHTQKQITVNGLIDCGITSLEYLRLRNCSSFLPFTRQHFGGGEITFRWLVIQAQNRSIIDPVRYREDCGSRRRCSPLTMYTMDYLKRDCEYRDTLAQVLLQIPITILVPNTIFNRQWKRRKQVWEGRNGRRHMWEGEAIIRFSFSGGQHHERETKF